MTWTVDSTITITAANQKTDGHIRLHPGACPDLRAQLTKTSDPDEFLLPIGWTHTVATEGENVDYWYKSPTGQQWTDRQCGTAAYSGEWGMGTWLIVGGLAVAGYLFWKNYKGKRGKTRSSSRKRIRR